MFRLFGYAGTGKTTMAKEIPAALGLEGNVRYGTFTGKAAHVLRSKGAQPVSTIHSAVYFPTSSTEAKLALEAARTELAEIDDETADTSSILAERRAELEALIPELEANARRIRWEWNPESEWSRTGLIILDEVSMVDAKLAADVEAYGVPILVLGDPAQLPPVDGGGYYTNAKPDHMLDEIHRYALDNPITALATSVRESTGAALGLTQDNLVPASIRHAATHDQVLVWSNKRRWAMINALRSLKGYPRDEVVAGDRIMILTNDKDLAVFNGQQASVLDVTPGTLGPTLTLRLEDGRETTMPVYADGFMGLDLQNQAKKSGAGMRGNRALATFADAITVHKAQGSEWSKVYVVNETGAMISMKARKEGREAGISEARKWLYTAVTRAQDSVTITAPAQRG